MERLYNVHNTVIQAVKRPVFLVAFLKRRLRMRLHMQTEYRQVMTPHEMPDTNVVEAREKLAS